MSAPERLQEHRTSRDYLNGCITGLVKPIMATVCNLRSPLVCLLHMSDWHLGQTLSTFSRHPEHFRFLDWLIETVAERAIDIVLISGDVYDTMSRSVASPFGGACFIGLILFLFTVTMSRKSSVTQTAQAVRWALTANSEASPRSDLLNCPISSGERAEK